jgi:membrane associated rhomboid family serine protease
LFNLIVKLIDHVVWPMVGIVAIWLVFFLNAGYGLNLNNYGMRPLQLEGLIGIFTMPFLHGDFDHLFSNSVPLVLSTAFIFLFFNAYKYKIIFLNALTTGIILWFIGDKGSLHIGASGLVYAYIAFLVTHAFLTKNKEMIASAFILIFLYGSLIYGIFPEYGLLIGKNISWEGHLAGALSGISWAFVFRKKGPQQKVFFEDEDEEDDDDEWGYWNIDVQEHDKIIYHYKRKSTD